MKLQDAQAGHIYVLTDIIEIGSFSSIGPGPQKIPVTILMLIRYRDEKIIFYEIIANSVIALHNFLFNSGPLLMDPSYGSNVQEVPSSDLPLYINLPVKRNAFINILKGDGPKDKVLSLEQIVTYLKKENQKEGLEDTDINHECCNTITHDK